MSEDQSRIFRLLKNLATLKSRYCTSTPDSEECFRKIAEDIDWLVKQVELKSSSGSEQDSLKKVHKNIQTLNDILWGPKEK